MQQNAWVNMVEGTVLKVMLFKKLCIKFLSYKMSLLSQPPEHR